MAAAVSVVQEELRGQLETEKEMKTFGVEEVQSRLPDDVTSKPLSCCHPPSPPPPSVHTPSPHSPGLSYWLARRLPISDEGKLELLSLGCPTLRLLHGLHTLRVGAYTQGMGLPYTLYTRQIAPTHLPIPTQEFTELCCLTCETCIAKKENIFRCVAAALPRSPSLLSPAIPPPPPQHVSGRAPGSLRQPRRPCARHTHCYHGDQPTHTR